LIGKGGGGKTGSNSRRHKNREKNLLRAIGVSKEKKKDPSENATKVAVENLRKAENQEGEVH